MEPATTTTTVTLSQYQPCKVFPSEVADYYCTLCYEPCSALALLVGPHTNHPRRRLVEALEVMPAEFIREEAEFRHAVGVFSGEVDTHQSNAVQYQRTVHDEIAAIDQQIEALKRKKKNLERKMQEQSEVQEQEQVALHTHAKELVAVGQRYLRAIAILKPYYQESFAAGGVIPVNSFKCSVEELSKSERNLINDLESLNAATALVGNREARGHVTHTSAAAAATSGYEGMVATPQPFAATTQHNQQTSRAFVSPISPAFHHPPSVADDDVKESINAVQHQLAERLAESRQEETTQFSTVSHKDSRHRRSSRDGGASTPPQGPAAEMAAAHSIQHDASVFFNAAQGFIPNPSAPVPFGASPSRTTADRDALLSHVLSNQEQHIVSAAAASATTPSKKQHERSHASTAAPVDESAAAADAAPHATTFANVSNSNDQEEVLDTSTEILRQVLRARNTDPSTSSSSYSSTPECEAVTANTSTVNVSSYTSGTTGTGFGTMSAGTGFTATTVDPRDTSKLATRLLKQYRRVRQCLRDATVGKQHKLAKSLLKTISELRAEANSYHIDVIEAAVGVDEELLDLLR